MDVTLCLNLISTHKILPEGLHRETRDPLDYVPADIIDVPTDDRSMDMRGARSHWYRCEFRGDVYPRIPEEVSVYRHEPNGWSEGERTEWEGVGR